MTLLAVALCVLGLVFVFAQFGGRISASRSVSWWLVAVFIALAAVSPEVYKPVAEVLGIKFVSNFVLAGLVMFLFAQAYESAGLLSHAQRQIRSIVSTQAARDFKPRAVRYLVVLPCFNEEENLPAVCAALRALQQKMPELGFCIVNDGSRDQSLSVLQESAPDSFVTHSANLGVSGALLTGFKVASQLNAVAVVQCDSDGQHPIAEIPAMLAEFQKTEIDCLVGSRFVRTASLARIAESTTWVRRCGGLLIAFILRLTTTGHVRVSDPTSGFRVYSQRAYQFLMTAMPDEYPEPEILANLGGAGMVIAEKEIHMQKRMAGTSSLTAFKSALYMVKVATALTGSKLRKLMLGAK